MTDQQLKKLKRQLQGIIKTINESLREAPPNQQLVEYNKEVAEIIKLFEPVNHNFKAWYVNTNQRKAVQSLLENYGFQQVSTVIKLLPKSNITPYFPNITTPMQLNEKYIDLVNAYTKKKQECQSKIPTINLDQ